MIRFLPLLIPLLATPAVAAVPAAAASTAEPSIAGLWLTEDRGGVIAVSQCDDHLCARIAGVVLDRPGDAMPRDYRGVSQCHLPLVDDASPIAPNLWKGHIRDPRNGGEYGVELKLNPNDTLALRGFLGIPLLGHTQIWTRFTGAVPDDCRMSTVDQVADRTLTDTSKRR